MGFRINGCKNAPERWLYRTETGRWLTAFLVSLGMLVAVFAFIHPVFMTIDDARLKYVYAGYSTGTPVSTYLFCYYPLSLILSGLYKVLPSIPWYAIYQFGVIGLGSALIGKTIYRIAYRKHLSFAIAILLHVGLYASLALISTILMHFEITAAVISTAGVVILLGIDFQKDSKRLMIIDGITSALCIALSFVIQFNAFYAICCYVLVALVVIAASAYQNAAIRKVGASLLYYLLALAVLIGGVKLADNLSKNTPEWDAYREYNKYRVSFWDYDHIDYQDDPELFESIGWSEEFYDITQSMYFMDERFNEDNLKVFTKRFSWFNLESFDVLVATAQETFSTLFKTERVAVLQTALFFLLGAIIIFLCCSKERWRKHYPKLIGLICCFAGTLFLALFLAARGRLPLRAWMAFSMPALATMVILILQVFQFKNWKPSEIARGSFAAGLLCALWLVSMVWTYNKVVNVDWQWRTDRNYHTLLVEKYAAEHPDRIFVYDQMAAQNYSVFSSYPDSEHRPSNAFVWGSSYLFTPAYQEQLEANGIDQLLTENLFDDNVYFITSSGGYYLNQLKNMLSEDYGEFDVKAISMIGKKFVVYKFTR